MTAQFVARQSAEDVTVKRMVAIRARHELADETHLDCDACFLLGLLQETAMNLVIGQQEHRADPNSRFLSWNSRA